MDTTRAGAYWLGPLLTSLVGAVLVMAAIAAGAVAVGRLLGYTPRALGSAVVRALFGDVR